MVSQLRSGMVVSTSFGPLIIFDWKRAPRFGVLSNCASAEYRISDKAHPVMLGSYDYSKKVLRVLCPSSGFLQQSRPN
jgi:hypothetical protein